MSYYILPKIHNYILLNPQSDDVCNIFVSFSIFKYYNEMINQINDICKNEIDNSLNMVNTFNEMVKIVNPYEFIFSTVPGSKYSVSKLKTNTKYFYDLLEICTAFNIFDKFDFNITSLHINNNCEDILNCYNIMRENFCDNIFYYKKFEDEIFKTDRKFNFIFIDTCDNKLNNYITNFTQAIMLILKCCLNNSNIIIKIEHSIYKPIIDLIYFLSSLFDKVYIIKPNTTNITSFEKYIVCKGFIFNDSKSENYKLNYYKLLVFLKKLDQKKIVSIVGQKLPYYFVNKLDDINIIFGQQQLDFLDQIITILKSKNKEDKIDAIKKSNIQKSVNWCEKYRIPCNKFIEKTNIFLPIVKEENKNDIKQFELNAN